MATQQLQLIGLPGVPVVEPGDDIAALIIEAAARADLCLQDGDVIAIAQKIISKSENRYVYLRTVAPSAEAKALAVKVDKEPELVQLMLDQSVEVVRYRTGAVIVEHKLGYVHANAGIDKSNISHDPNNPRVLLLPANPDASARQLRATLRERTGATVGVIVNDSAGRAWRNGTVGFALGTAGLVPLQNLIGQRDMFGRPLEITQVAVADELAAAASFVMGQAAEGIPVVLIRGAGLAAADDVDSKALIRPRAEDLFR